MPASIGNEKRLLSERLGEIIKAIEALDEGTAIKALRGLQRTLDQLPEDQ